MRELGIALVAWSPLGGGFLTGTVDKLGENDFRQNNPRFSGNNLDTNRERFAPLMALAGDFNLGPAQLALAWLLHQGQDIIPIPGTRSIQRIDENAKAINVELDDATLQRIDEIAKPGIAQGATLL